MEPEEAPEEPSFDVELHRRIDEIRDGSVVLMTMEELNRKLDEVRAKYAHLVDE